MKTRAYRKRGDLGSPAAVPVPGGVKASILKYLARGPLTSAELHERIGGLAGTIYSTLIALRGAGLVEMRVDDSDGLRKNYLVGKEEATA